MSVLDPYNHRTRSKHFCGKDLISSRDILIVSSTFLKNDIYCDIVNDWFKCVDRYNPLSHRLMIDNGSPDDLFVKLQHDLFVKHKTCDLRVNDVPFPDLSDCELSNKNTVIRLNMNHGHYMGAAVALSIGLQVAKLLKFKYIVHLESDFFFKGNIMSIIGAMYRKPQHKLVVPLCKLYRWIESGLMFMNVDYFADIDFTNQFVSPFNMLWEHKMHHITGINNTKIMNWPGDRDECNQVDITKAIYITHTTTEKRRKFIDLPVPEFNLGMD